MIQMKRHKILSFLLALIVSLALWVYAVTFVNPNDTISISDVRVRITGMASLEADGLMLTGGEEQFVDVEIAGRRSDLKELNSGNMEAIADVSNIDGPGTFEVSWTISPPASVASGDIRLVSSSSNRISVKVSERREREIPVELRYDKERLPAGYDLGEIDYTAFVAVGGPANEVNAIAKAVVNVDLKDQTSKINDTMTYVFEDADGKVLTLSKYMYVSAEKVGVMVQILPYKDIALDVAFLAGGGLTEQDVTYTVTPGSIRVTGTEEALAAMPDTLVSENLIDLSLVEGLEPEVIKHQFELPDGVTRWGDSAVSTITADVEIDINDTIGILRIPLSKTELSYTNAEENMEYSYADADQEIEIRGDVTVLEQLETKLNKRLARILVTIDIAQMDQTQMCVLTIELPQDFAVGLFKQYSARIDVKEIVTEPPVIDPPPVEDPPPSEDPEPSSEA